MLNEKQCIEIAEKVWGWEFDVTRSKLNGIYLCDIEKEVNSWQGFGRTVEDMEKHDTTFECDETWAGFKLNTEDHKWPQGYCVDIDYAGGLIPATHLAALEAMKND